MRLLRHGIITAFAVLAWSGCGGEIGDADTTGSTTQSLTFSDHCVRRGPVLGNYVDVCVRLLQLGAGRQQMHYAMKDVNSGGAVHLEIDQRYGYTNALLNTYVDTELFYSGTTPDNGRSYIWQNSPVQQVPSYDFSLTGDFYYSIRWRNGQLTQGHLYNDH